MKMYMSYDKFVRSETKIKTEQKLQTSFLNILCYL